MTVTNSFRTLILLLTASVTLVSCAKKDSEFKGRRNASNAVYAGDPAKNAAADQAAASMGLVADITRTADPVLIAQGKVGIQSELVVNGAYFDITTEHNNFQETVVQGNVGAFHLTATGLCVTENCSPYYLMLTYRKGNQEVKQTVLKKFFFYGGEATQSDYIISRPAGQFVNMQQAKQILDSAVEPE